MFALRNLSVLVYAQGFTHWHYRAMGLHQAQITAPGFFNPCADMISAGDIFFVTGLIDGAVQIYVQTATNLGGVVVVVMSSTPAVGSVAEAA